MAADKKPRAYSREEQNAAFAAWIEAREKESREILRNQNPDLEQAVRTAREALRPFWQAFPWPTYEWQQMDAARRGLEWLAEALERAKTETPL